MTCASVILVRFAGRSQISEVLIGFNCCYFYKIDLKILSLNAGWMEEFALLFLIQRRDIMFGEYFINFVNKKLAFTKYILSIKNTFQILIHLLL